MAIPTRESSDRIDLIPASRPGVKPQLARWRRVAIAAILLPVSSCAVDAVAPARYVRFAEVRPILTELAGALPPELAGLTEAQLDAQWPDWIARHDRNIRARLEQGDEDTIVNWLLFGTRSPRSLAR